MYYVYMLARPNGTPFYVGKGTGTRVFGHELEAKRCLKSGAPSGGTHHQRHGRICAPPLMPDGAHDGTHQANPLPIRVLLPLIAPPAIEDAIIGSL